MVMMMMMILYVEVPTGVACAVLSVVNIYVNSISLTVVVFPVHKTSIMNLSSR